MRWATGATGAAGAVRATTSRCRIAASGLRSVAWAPPTMPMAVGATAAIEETWPRRTTSCDTGTKPRCTGCDCANTAGATAVTAFGTCALR
jgi:hypothetical protein